MRLHEPLLGSHKRKLLVLLGASAFLIASLSTAGAAPPNILWNGDFETGDFMQYPWDNFSGPAFAPVEDWGEPTAAGSWQDGALLRIVKSPVRNHTYAATFRLRSASTGGLDDCDPQPGASGCTRRRTEIRNLAYEKRDKVSKYQTTRWFTISFYVDPNWHLGTLASWGPIVLQSKMISDTHPWFSLQIENGSWEIHVKWHPQAAPASVPWQYNMFWNKDYPKLGVTPRWDDGVSNFPTLQSQAALGSVLRGGWTDWIIKYNIDARGSGEGGQGLVEAWKREGNGSWIHVLSVRPRVTTRGGMTFDHGIGYPEDLAYWRTGLYSSAEQVVDAPADRIITIDNVRILDGSATFQEVAELWNTGEPADNSPPTQPTNLQAAAISSTQIDLTWNASADDVGVVGYNIYRDGIHIGTSTHTGYSDTGVVASTAYSYTVAAHDAAGKVSPQSAAASATTPAPAGPVASYGLEDAAPTTAADSSGHDNTATIAGAAFATGKYGQGLSFDGKADVVSAGNPSSLNNIFSRGGTLSAWIFPTGLGGYNRGRIIDKSVDETISDGYALYFYDTTALKFSHSFSGGTAAWTAPLSSITLNQWHHIAITYDSSSVSNNPRVYVDGVAQSLTATRPSGTAKSDAANSLRIGNAAAGNRGFQGIIDEVRIYDRMLTQSEIQADMAAPIAAAPPVGNLTPPQAFRVRPR